MICRQALILSAVGIPIGLASGYAVSDLIFPFVMEMTAYTDLDLKIKFRLSVAVFGILFALITVFISCRKPEKLQEVFLLSKLFVIQRETEAVKITKNQKPALRFTVWLFPIWDAAEKRQLWFWFLYP